MEPRKDVLSLALKPRIPVAKTFLGLKWDTQNTPFFIPNNENSTLNLRLEKINDATKSKRSDKIHRNKQPKWGYHWSVASMTGASTGGQPRFMKTNATSWELPQINTPKVAVYVSTISRALYKMPKCPPVLEDTRCTPEQTCAHNWMLDAKGFTHFYCYRIIQVATIRINQKPGMTRSNVSSKQRRRQRAQADQIWLISTQLVIFNDS